MGTQTRLEHIEKILIVSCWAAFFMLIMGGVFLEIQASTALKRASADEGEISMQIADAVDHVNRPCQGPSSLEACGTLAEAGKLMGAGKKLMQQSSELMTNESATVDGVNKAVPGLLADAHGTLAEARNSIATVGTIAPHANKAIDQLATVAPKLNEAMDSVETIAPHANLAVDAVTAAAQSVPPAVGSLQQDLDAARPGIVAASNTSADLQKGVEKAQHGWLYRIFFH